MNKKRGTEKKNKQKKRKNEKKDLRCNRVVAIKENKK